MREAISAALLATPLNRYPDPMANDLRDALARRHGTDRAHVVVGNGGDELLFNLLFAFGGPGRVLVTCPPDFAEYANFARMTETEVRGVPRDADDFSIDADALVAAAEGAALVILTSPNNPTGDLVDRALVRRLLDETDALVLVDEAYVEFAGEERSLVGLVADNPRLMVLRTLSKAFALAGLRVGYLVADPAVVGALAAVRQIYSVDVLAQAVALALVLLDPAARPVLLEQRGQRHAVVSPGEAHELGAGHAYAHPVQDVVDQLEVLALGVAERAVKVKEHRLEAVWPCHGPPLPWSPTSPQVYQKVRVKGF